MKGWFRFLREFHRPLGIAFVLALAAGAYAHVVISWAGAAEAHAEAVPDSLHDLAISIAMPAGDELSPVDQYVWAHYRIDPVSADTGSIR